MAILNNKEEVAIVSGIFTVGVTATYVSQMTVIPEGPRILIASILGLIAFVGGTFWAVYVKAAGDPTSIPTPYQVSQPSTQKVAEPAASAASSDAQAASKS
jgi:hypothetical protein